MVNIVRTEEASSPAVITDGDSIGHSIGHSNNFHQRRFFEEKIFQFKCRLWFTVWIEDLSHRIFQSEGSYQERVFKFSNFLIF